MRSNFKAPFLEFQNSTKPPSQVNHQPQPLSFIDNTKEPCITATDHLRHPQLYRAHSAAVKKEIKAIFFPLLFMSKRATECVIQSGELGVGRQLALDSMKASAIHSLYSLLDRNIIHSIITEYGCRRRAKPSQRAIVIASLAAFTFSWICCFSLCHDFCMEMRSE